VTFDAACPTDGALHQDATTISGDLRINARTS
jgi:hypothetical protein